MRVYPVIMCGGGGTRLWPASRPDRPKPFLPLIGARSLFQETVSRVAGLADLAETLVVGAVEHQAWIEAQLGELGTRATLILEPEGRDSAPAIAAAALWIAGRDPEGVAVIVASDHDIPDPAAFAEAISLAVAGAASGRLIVLGVRPDTPSEAYGYIRPGAPAGDLLTVDHFVEKPDGPTALRYLSEGYLWNSGNLVARAAALIDELQRYAPDVLASARASLGDAGQTAARLHLGPEFAGAPRISMDYAVLNRTGNAAVLPVSFAWSDLGAWAAVWAASPRGEDGNAVQGRAEFVGSNGCLVRGPAHQLVGVVGLSNVAVIVEDDAILVCDLDASQGVRTLAGRMDAAGRTPGGAPSVGAWTEADLHPAATGNDQAEVRRLRTWLDSTALPLWWALGADHANGGFHEQLSQAGQPLDLPRRARVQARQAYVYAAAGLAGWPGPWRTACEHALDFLLRHYRREDGLVRSSVSRNGKPEDETPRLYDQAFVMLALATSARALPDRTDLLPEAGRIAAALGHFRLPGGGFREEGEDPFQANCHMHLLESALALANVEPDGVWDALADELVDLALNRFIQQGSGRLLEFFDEAWRPRRVEGDLIVEPGHQFEWAWLLSQHQARRDGLDLSPVIGRLLASGRDGINARGVLINRLDDSGRPVDSRARLWPQTEWLRASTLPGMPPSDRGRAAAALSPYLATAIPGLWHDQLDPAGGVGEGPVLASSLYHLAGAILAISPCQVGA